MKKYYYNPELRRSSLAIVSAMIIFTIINIVALKVNNDRLKESYVNTVAKVLECVIDKYPEMEKDIIPIITKAEDNKLIIDKGADRLKEYGLTKNLETSLFPYVNKAFHRNTMVVITLWSVMLIGFLILNYFQYSVIYRRIREIIFLSNNIVEGNFDINIDEHKEGEFSKLSVALRNMRDVIRNNINEIKKEKKFLVELLSDISHQLKTPLSSMIVYNDIMINKDITKEQREKFLLNNEVQLHRMRWLIQSILKLAKIDAKAIEFNKEEDSLKETIYDAMETLEELAKRNNITVDFKETEDIIMIHDTLWLQEAIINILKNGIEHTEEDGYIYISLIENPIYKKIIIEDTGVGIKEEDLPHIFKRFYKIKTSKKSDSVGIGLALAKSIVEEHNGIIEVDSKLGIGTKFTMTFYNY